MDEDFKITLNEYSPLRDIVFNNIKDAIVTGALKPGQRLMEKQLSERLGVSRTPIREALRKLELEGFVAMMPRKGAMVAVISIKDIEDVLEIRAALESLAARLACKYMTKEEIIKLQSAKEEFEIAANALDIDVMAEKDVAFHEHIFLSTHNAKLVQLISNLSDKIHQYRLVYLKDNNYRMKILKEHDALINAIIKKDISQAEKIATTHIENQKKAVIRSISF